MPTLFDSHSEFQDWFAKDIENHAVGQALLNESKLIIWSCHGNVMKDN
jgi:DNA helicase INO80